MIIFANKFNEKGKSKKLTAMEINNENYDAIIGGEKPVVLDFWATWCGPCMRVAPIMEELAEQYKDQVVVGKVDVEECDDLAAKYSIRNIPTILFIKGGQVVDKVVGATTKENYEAKIKAML